MFPAISWAGGHCYAWCRRQKPLEPAPTLLRRPARHHTRFCQGVCLRYGDDERLARNGPKIESAIVEWQIEEAHTDLPAVQPLHHLVRPHLVQDSSTSGKLRGCVRNLL